MRWGSTMRSNASSRGASGRRSRPGGRSSPAERFGTPQSQFHPPWPDFAIAIGRLTTPYIRRLKRVAGLATYTIILQNPKVSARTADLFWVPEHDTRRGPNVDHDSDRAAQLHGAAPARAARQHAGGHRGAAAAARGGAARRPERRFPLHASGARRLAAALQSLGRARRGADDHAVAAHAGRRHGLRARGDGRHAAHLLGRRGRQSLSAVPGACGCLHRAGRTPST